MPGAHILCVLAPTPYWLPPIGGFLRTRRQAVGAGKPSTRERSMTTAITTTGRSLIDAAVFDRLSQRIVTDHGLPLELAQRIVDQTGAFLKACADNPGAALSPSMTVDLGWHAFVLHTGDYARFCQQVAGRFIHHEPTGPEDGTDQGSEVLATTVDAIRRSGMMIDPKLWPDAADCSQCHAGCHDSPTTP